MTTADRGGWRRRTKAVLLSVLGALLLLEGAVRIRQYVKYGTTATTFYRLETHASSGLEIPAPGYTAGPIRVSSLGFRGPEIEVPKPPGRIRVAFLGGSTTFCAEASSLAETWPELVVAELRERHPERTFDYVNAGTAGYSTQQSLRNLEHRVAPLEPDVIVLYHATNDLTQDTRALAAEQGLYDLARREESWLSQYWLTWYLIEKNWRYGVRKRDRTGEATLQFDPRELSRPFVERLNALVSKAREVAPVVCVVTFSHRGRRGQNPEEMRDACASSLYYMPFMDAEGVLAGFEEYNRVIREVARMNGVILVEGEEQIPADAAHFRDSVHFEDPGQVIQAERVVTGLEHAPVFRGVVKGAGDG